MYKLPDGAVVSGDAWTTLDGVQYLLGQLSDAELAALGVERYFPPPPSLPSYDPTLDMGGSIREVITGS